MGLKYLWDTNTAIYYLQKHFHQKQQEIISNIINSYQPAISVITEIELLCWRGASDKDLNIINEFIADCAVFGLEEDIKQNTITVRKKSNLKLPDAIIAATAIVKDLILISRNEADFKKVPQIVLLNPFMN
jgi:predicted nucleic acid-binding protein